MEQLKADRASAVRQAYVEGLSYEELATLHGVPLNTMRTWLRRSLLKLRECLGP
jgi:RNA polymerase sigma-70 factor (ECF subfamily)